MFNSNFKNPLIIILLTVVSYTTKANEGVKPTFTINGMELKLKNSNTIEINLNLASKTNETLELQKSYNNVDFNTVSIIFAEENDQLLKPIKINDKVKTEKNNTVYYRVVKINKESAVKVMSNYIELNK